MSLALLLVKLYHRYMHLYLQGLYVCKNVCVFVKFHDLRDAVAIMPPLLSRHRAAEGEHTNLR